MLLVLTPPLVAIGFGTSGDELESPWRDVFYRPFYETMGRTLKLLVATVGVTFLSAIIMALLLRRTPRVLLPLLFALLAFSVLLPPFLWAIGIQNLSSLFPYALQNWIDGFSGSVLAYSAVAFPIATAVAYASTRSIHPTMRHAAMLHGNDGILFLLEARFIWPAALGGALLGALFALADAGTGNITGYHTVSTDILVSFVTRNNFPSALAKTMALTAVFLPLFALATILLTRHLSVRELAKSLSRRKFGSKGMGSFVAGGMALILSGTFIVPSLLGHLRPLRTSPNESAVHEANELFFETLPTTCLYFFAAALSASLLALVLGLAGRRVPRFSYFLVVASLVTLTIPPAFHGFGVISLRSILPVGVSAIENPFVTGAIHGVRLAPLAALPALFALLRIPTSAEAVAEVHSVPPHQTLLQLYLPAALPGLAAGALLAGAAVLADVSTSILIQVPGQSTLGNVLFARMDNSSEKLISALCFLYSIPALVVSLCLAAIYSLPSQQNEYREQFG